MLALIAQRLVATIAVMGVVGVLVFALVHLAPGDPAVVIAGDSATAEQVAAIRAKLRLDDPLLTQFFVWARAVLSGDLGQSIFSDLPVSQLISQRIWPTLSLTLVTLLFAVSTAVSIGVMAATRPGSWLDHTVMLGAVLSFSVPVFVVGYGLIYLFALKLQWLPVQGYRPLADGIGLWLRHLILPALTLSLAYLALIARITRAAMLDVLAEDYMRTARAKGVPPAAQHWKHALRNAGVPILTVVGIGVALLIGGVVITETVFNIPGMGRLMVDAIAKRDYPLIQGVILVFSGVYVLINLAIDLAYGVIDPRIRV
jgi:peptide/nickel transport system permease protein